jgi:hypothetical protein
LGSFLFIVDFVVDFTFDSFEIGLAAFGVSFVTGW